MLPGQKKPTERNKQKYVFDSYKEIIKLNLKVEKLIRKFYIPFLSNASTMKR